MWIILGWLFFVNVERDFYIGRMCLKKCQKFQENVDVIFMLLQFQRSLVGIRLSKSTCASVSWVMMYFAHLFQTT